MDIFGAISFSDLLILISSLVFLGVFAGFLSGLLGVGGGIVLVPGLFFIFEKLQPTFGFDAGNIMHVCVATSLATIIPTGFSSALAHKKRGSIDLQLVKLIGGGIVLGVGGATVIANGLSGATLKLIFASALMVLALIMLLNPSRFKISDELPTPFFASLAGLVIGFLSSLIGIGGATLSVPYMTLHGVNIHRAIGTASALGLVISIPATIGFIFIGWPIQNLPPFSLGYVNLLAWLCIIPCSVLIAPLGAAAAHKISVTRLKKIFAIFMLCVALNMWRKIMMP